MIYQLNIANGFCQFAGPAKFLKIISASSPLKIEVLANGTRSGRVLLSSKNVRAPMGFELPADAGVVNFYGEDQSLEIWSGDQPLEYLQLTAVGGSKIKTSQVGLSAGTLQKVLEPTPRKKVLVKTTTPITLKSDPLEQGWPLGENEQIELELTGALYAQKAASTFISAADSHAEVGAVNYFVDNNTAINFYRKMANGDVIVQTYREELTIYLAAGGTISGWGLACDDPKTGHVYVLFAPLSSQAAAKARIYRHTGEELAFLLETKTAINVDKDGMSLGADNALYLGGWFSGYKVIRFDLVTAEISFFTSASYVGCCTCAIDGFIYYVTNSTLLKRKGMAGTDETVLSGLPNASGVVSKGYQNVFFLRPAGTTAKTSRLVNLLTLENFAVSEPAAVNASERYTGFYNGTDWFFGNGDGRLLRLQNNALQIVGGAVLNDGTRKCSFAGYDGQAQKIVVGVSPAANEIKAATIDVVTLGDSRPAVVSTLETFI